MLIRLQPIRHALQRHVYVLFPPRNKKPVITQKCSMNRFYFMSYNKALYFSQNATTFVMNLPVAYNLPLHLIELITLVSRMYFVVSCGSKLLRITDLGAVSLSSSSKFNRHSLRFGTLFFFFFYKNIVFPGQAEYSHFSANFRL